MLPRASRVRQWIGAAACFLCCLGYSVVVVAGCSCSLCASGFCCGLSSEISTQDSSDEFPSADFRVGDRWRSNATDGGSNTSRGAPRTLTWGLVRDGTSITGSREGTSPSNLIRWLDSLYGEGPGGEDFVDRPWFGLIESAFERWEELSGLTFNYESADLGAPIDSTPSPNGSLGRYADHRIGGHTVVPGVLAYNYFPDHADMVIDTFDGFYNNLSNNSRALRNVIMHEIGHGLGFNHLDSNNSGQLMEPAINLGFDGPQIDDILAVHRNYGDTLEKGGGNDSPESATPVEFEVSRNGTFFSIGVHGQSPTVSPGQTDFVSIDGSSDEDFFVFTVEEPSLVDLTLTQVGRTYNEGPQDGDQSPLVTSQLNDLELDVLSVGFDGRNPSGFETLAEGVGSPTGDGESIESLLAVPGTEYYARVRGTVDNVQLYRLDITPIATVLPPLLPGDFNGDGIVNLADYTVWQENLGQSHDLNGNGAETGASAGVVDAADYDLWRNNFGALADATTQANFAIPEPSAGMLLACLCLVTSRCRRGVRCG